MMAFLCNAFFMMAFISQCHGLWDEDAPKDKKEPLRRDESEYEGGDKEKVEEEATSSVTRERRGSTHTLKSINLGTSVDSVHVHVHYPQQQTYQRRKSSSGGSHISHRSSHSARSKRGTGL